MWYPRFFRTPCCSLSLVSLLGACDGVEPMPVISDVPGGGNAEPAARNGTVAKNSFRWSTQGGGHLEFTVTRVSNDELRILVTGYEFQEVSRTLSLTRVSGPAFKTARGLVDGTLVPASLPPGGLTGTWTSITLPSRVIDDVVLTPQLRSLARFVERTMESGRADDME